VYVNTLPLIGGPLSWKYYYVRYRDWWFESYDRKHNDALCTHADFELRMDWGGNTYHIMESIWSLCSLTTDALLLTGWLVLKLSLLNAISVVWILMRKLIIQMHNLVCGFRSLVCIICLLIAVILIPRSQSRCHHLINLSGQSIILFVSLTFQ
jgi:hypothetical protein